jgi:hypothetical protein
MKVYRVGHRWHVNSGTKLPSGPYAFGYTLPDYIADRINSMRWVHQDDRHPGPIREPELDGIGVHEVCGLASMDALNGWFEHHWRLRLHQAGYRVNVYDVPEVHVRHGRYQVVFDPREAKHVENLTLAEGCAMLHGGEDPEEDKLCTSHWRLAPGSWARNPCEEDVIRRATPRRPRPLSTRPA